jgi:type IV secretory pathway VirB2 component (pilin)
MVKEVHKTQNPCEDKLVEFDKSLSKYVAKILIIIIIIICCINTNNNNIKK